MAALFIYPLFYLIIDDRNSLQRDISLAALPRSLSRLTRYRRSACSIEERQELESISARSDGTVASNASDIFGSNNVEAAHKAFSAVFEFIVEIDTL